MKIKKADSIEPRLCGCGSVHVYLRDAKGRAFAFFSLRADHWVPFGEECARIAQGEEPHGQPDQPEVLQRRMLQ